MITTSLNLLNNIKLDLDENLPGKFIAFFETLLHKYSKEIEEIYGQKYTMDYLLENPHSMLRTIDELQLLDTYYLHTDYLIDDSVFFENCNSVEGTLLGLITLTISGKEIEIFISEQGQDWTDPMLVVYYLSDGKLARFVPIEGNSLAVFEIIVESESPIKEDILNAIYYIDGNTFNYENAKKYVETNSEELYDLDKFITELVLNIKNNIK